MTNKFLKLNVFFFVLILIGAIFSVAIKADELDTCDFLPCDEVSGDNSADSESVNDQIEQVAKFGAGLVFTGFIGYGVYKILKAAIKIIKSETNADQLQEGQQSVKGVFIGLGMIFLGIIGLVLLAVVFNSSGIFNNNVQEPGELDLPLVD